MTNLAKEIKTVTGTVVTANKQIISKDKKVTKGIANKKYVTLAMECGNKVLAITDLLNRAEKTRIEMNKIVTKLYAAKITIGRRPNCNMANAFYDTLIGVKLDENGKPVLNDKGEKVFLEGIKPLAAGTASNYLSHLTKAVKGGKEIKQLNQHRPVSDKGGKSGKNGKGNTRTLTPEEVTAQDNEKVALWLKPLINYKEGKIFHDLCTMAVDAVKAKKQPSNYAFFLNFMDMEGFEVTMAGNIGTVKAAKKE